MTFPAKSSDPFASLRHELAGMCEKKDKRRHHFSRSMPNEWQPTTINDPSTICVEFPKGIAFSDESAWRFIAEQLRSGVALEEVALDKPAGKKGYAFTVEILNRRLYVKIMPDRGMVYGRSFHWSYA